MNTTGWRIKRWVCSFVQGWPGQTVPLQCRILIRMEMRWTGIMQWRHQNLCIGFVNGTYMKKCNFITHVCIILNEAKHTYSAQFQFYCFLINVCHLHLKKYKCGDGKYKSKITHTYTPTVHAHVDTNVVRWIFAQYASELLIHTHVNTHTHKFPCKCTYKYVTTPKHTHTQMHTDTYTPSLFSVVEHLPHIKNKFIQSQFGECLAMQGRNTIWALGIVDCSPSPWGILFVYLFGVIKNTMMNAYFFQMNNLKELAADESGKSISVERVARSDGFTVRLRGLCFLSVGGKEVIWTPVCHVELELVKYTFNAPRKEFI